MPPAGKITSEAPSDSDMSHCKELLITDTSVLDHAVGDTPPTTESYVEGGFIEGGSGGPEPHMRGRGPACPPRWPYAALTVNGTQLPSVKEYR